MEWRALDQHVLLGMTNPNRAWVHNVGPQQQSTFLLWVVFWVEPVRGRR